MDGNIESGDMQSEVRRRWFGPVRSIRQSKIKKAFSRRKRMYEWCPHFKVDISGALGMGFFGRGGGALCKVNT